MPKTYIPNDAPPDMACRILRAAALAAIRDALARVGDWRQYLMGEQYLAARRAIDALSDAMGTIAAIESPDLSGDPGKVR